MAKRKYAYQMAAKKKAEKRRALARTLKASGMTWGAVGAEMGISAARAWQLANAKGQ